MSFKLRAQLIIALVVIAVSSTFTFFHISNERRYASERSERSSENVKMAFDSMVRDTEHFYTFRAYANVRSEGVIEAIKKRDTETLYRLTLPRYKTLHEENPLLSIMQFHASDGRSILRMHRKEQFGDNIALRRPMLRAVHSTRKMVSGFEGGVGGIAFRIIMPVFDKEEYVGALEFGIDTPFFVDKIKQITGSESILLIHENVLGAADKSQYAEGIGEYRYASITEGQKGYMRAFMDKNPRMESKNIRIDSKDYEINPLFLHDSEGKKVGAVICINDVTGGYQNSVEAVVGSIVLTAILLILFWSLFEYAFGSLIGKLNLQERYIKTILNSQKNIVVVTDGKKIIYANLAFFDYFGYATLDNFLSEHSCICDFFESGESNEYLQSNMDGMLWTEYLLRYSSLEHKVKMCVAGKTSIFTVNSQKMTYDDQIRHVVVFTDITKLNELATQDVLTQVANRFQFDKVLEHSITLSQRYGRALSMMLIDIDHFKEVNDTYGHLIGDEVLKKLAHILTKGIRKSDIVARWGGEEFVILLPDSELSAAEKLAETLRLKIAESDFKPIIQVTCSIGVVQWNQGESSDHFLKRVDEKLYLAKESGRNCVVC
ncbi:diguanylate cyclase [Sulfuricurvum sp.]|uniref:sensor domain-containing diguanylate cyclase n=1 Tax=Sulfuricurvum sp. TaxID=2025608 RepID=UPI003C46C64A